MLEWHEILKELNQSFSAAYQWSIGGVIDGKRKLTLKKYPHRQWDSIGDKHPDTASMMIDSQIEMSDIYYAGYSLRNMLTERRD